jgi:hypothetical protein
MERGCNATAKLRLIGMRQRQQAISRERGETHVKTVGRKTYNRAPVHEGDKVKHEGEEARRIEGQESRDRWRFEGIRAWETQWLQLPQSLLRQ